jgi:hypothetical protein
MGDTQTDRDECDFINLRNYGGYTDRWTDTDGHTDRQEGDHISPVLFFQEGKAGQTLSLIQQVYRMQRNRLPKLL